MMTTKRFVNLVLHWDNVRQSALCNASQEAQAWENVLHAWRGNEPLTKSRAADYAAEFRRNQEQWDRRGDRRRREQIARQIKATRRADGGYDVTIKGETVGYTRELIEQYIKQDCGDGHDDLRHAVLIAMDRADEAASLPAAQ